MWRLAACIVRKGRVELQEEAFGAQCIASVGAFVPKAGRLTTPNPAQAGYQTQGGEFGRLAAMRAVLQLEQLCDFVQAEAWLLRRFHEFHPRDVRRTVAANAAIGSSS